MDWRKIILISCFIFLLWSISLFWIGFHNIDICVNEMNIENTFNISLLEIKLNGKIWSLSDCYLNGLEKIVIGFKLGLIGAFLFGLSLRGKNENKRIY